MKRKLLFLFKKVPKTLLYGWALQFMFLTASQAEDPDIRAKKSIFPSVRHLISDKNLDWAADEAVTHQNSVRIEITGTVTDENGAPIPGATVLIEGTTTGTATDIDGQFTIDAPEGAVLLISFIGYQSQRITIANQSFLN
ncbi:MAG: carboxypeptidase-like regulatory domain-containing protein, partial [Cyclobacteriaceae bacterium]